MAPQTGSIESGQFIIRTFRLVLSTHGGKKSVPPRGSGWVRSQDRIVKNKRAPIRYPDESGY